MRRKKYGHSAHPQSLDIISLASVKVCSISFSLQVNITDWQPAKWNWPICRPAIGYKTRFSCGQLICICINSYEECKINKLRFIWNIANCVHGTIKFQVRIQLKLNVLHCRRPFRSEFGHSERVAGVVRAKRTDRQLVGQKELGSIFMASIHPHIALFWAFTFVLYKYSIPYSWANAVIKQYSLVDNNMLSILRLYIWNDLSGNVSFDAYLPRSGVSTSA